MLALAKRRGHWNDSSNPGGAEIEKDGEQNG
jgi:hypothetical protein